MDPGNGRLVKLPPDFAQKPHTRLLIEVKRELTPQERDRQKIGRNAPCVCGSGVKAKRCCMTGFAQKTSEGR